MDLLEKFQKQLIAYSWQNKKIIVALSGGVDSMTLAALLKMSNLVTLHLAHCNFGLRGAESDADEKMVRDWAQEMAIPLDVQYFDTPKILEEKGGNLQETARKLRYDWFEALRKQNGFDFIAVGHHRQDAIETLLINFFKGTGISGMHGILNQQGKVIRPLLPFQKEELKAFAHSRHIPWREDSSNTKGDYLRNQIRHRLWPEICQVFPGAEQALWHNITRFSEIEMLYNEAISQYRKNLMERRDKDWYFSILKLKKCAPLSTILYEILNPFGFTTGQIPDISHLLNAESGKWVEAPNYRLLRDRNFLILTPKESIESTFIMIENRGERQNIEWEGHFLELTPLKEIKSVEEAKLKNLDSRVEIVALTDADFPLYLRLIRQGDYFYPLGMNRKKKKVGRFLRDLKVPLHEKEKIWVLESKKRIIWVLGYRIDERFKVRKNTEELVLLNLKKGNSMTKH